MSTPKTTPENPGGPSRTEPPGKAADTTGPSGEGRGDGPGEAAGATGPDGTNHGEGPGDACATDPGGTPGATGRGEGPGGTSRGEADGDAGVLGAGSGMFAPAPGGAPLRRMVAAQAGMELRALLRNGEQVLLVLVIPVGLLTLFSLAPLVDLGSGSRVGFLAPGILALAVMSTAFTGQAIGTGFERKYGVLKRLGATPLPRSGLVAAKTAAVLAVEAGQVVVIGAVALALGWRPHGGAGGALAVLALLLLGTAAFSGLGLLMAGTLRAEATLAGANLVYLILLGLGGVAFPLSRYPDALQPVLHALPISALADGLRAVLRLGAGPPAYDLAVLAAWAVAACAAAVYAFRWE